MNKRKYKRIEKPYMARLRIKQYEGLEISSSEWDMVALRDLSAGGGVEIKTGLYTSYVYKPINIC